MTRKLLPFVLLMLPALAFGQTNANSPVPTLRTDLRMHRSGPDAAPVTVPQLKYRQRTLPNGLTVYTIENHKSPTVAIQVSYRVGGKNDPEGKSGFAHLFEHLMFKSTKNMQAEMIDRFTEDIGGEDNAFTAEDRTVYHETVPSNYLETLIWAEADRMANLNVDEANFRSERAVVEEEYRQSVLAPPYGRLNEYVDQHSFLVHPYQRGVIGSIANLDAANLEDVRRFHNTFYRPDNAVLIVAGDFDPAKLDAWIDRYFGRIPKPMGAILRVTVQEPARNGEKRYDEQGPNVPLPAVVINYLVPPAADADAQALQIAGVLLSNGRSSRLYQALVYTQHVAAQASAMADLRVDAGLFQFETLAASGKTIEEAERATLAEIERLKTEPVSAQELAKARNQLLARAFRSRETAEGQAFALSQAVIMTGDPERVNTDLARLQAVTPQDVQRVARKYFTPVNRLVVHYQSGPGEQGGVSSAPSLSSAGATPAITPMETPPLPVRPRNAAFPKTTEKTLANGLRVVVLPRPGTGIVSVDAVVKVGGAADPANAAGLANFTASLLTRSTRTRSAAQIAEEAEALGGSIGSRADWDDSTVSLSVLAAHIADAMPLLADVLRNPAFAPEEQERLRTEELDGLAVSLRSPGTLARYVASRVVFGDTCYGHQLGGTPESLKAIQPVDVTRFYQDAYSPRQTVLVFGGDITPAAAFTLAETSFGSWANTTSRNMPQPPVMTTSSGNRVVVVDKPDAGQAAVLWVRSGIRRGDPSYEIAGVANAVLGGGYSARLNQEIRVKRGLSYGANSRFEEWRYGGLFLASAQTRNDAVPEVASLFASELARMATEKVSDAELVPRKASLSGNYARSLETGAGLTNAASALIAYDLPLTTLSKYLSRVQAVTTTEVEGFAARDLNPAQASIVIVGDARRFLTALQQKFPNTEVIPIADLDLNHASLKR